jgi:hypothetical protein
VSFSVGIFALAGVAAAAGPILVHLMNRRRFRTIDWAAMQFLREAVRQSRRVLHLRDLLLLALRTLCVLLFGLAMARPYFSSTDGAFGAGEPIHAVLLVDNSLSMGYRGTSGTVLDEARRRARAFVDQLPAGSRTAVIPVASDPRHYSLDPAATKQDALEALDAVALVDRPAGFNAALELGREALRRLPDMPNKRLVFVGDGQRTNFPAGGLEQSLAGPDAPSDLQIVSLAAPNAENAWVAELRAVDGAAAPGADCEFVAVVRYEGPARRPAVQVGFQVDGVLVQSRVVDLEPNQRRELSFVHRFEAAAESTGPRFGTVRVELSDDRLPDDNHRDVVVPILPSLNVLYVSQTGPSEPTPEAAAGRGLWIQRLLAPVVERGDVQPRLVRITHIAAEALEPRLLQEARLTVLAGLQSPEDSLPRDAVPLLRDYVNQGGQLLIAAGEGFDPGRWHDDAWLDGAGLLPAPLAARTVNVRTAAEVRPLRLDLRSLGHPYFEIDGAASDELADLYSGPLFFETVAAEATDDAAAKVVAAETARIVRERAVQEMDAAARSQPTGTASRGANIDKQTPPAVPLIRLGWMDPDADVGESLKPEEEAQAARPRIIGRYDNGLPFMVERQLGRGTILFCTTGLQSEWNTLAMSRAVVLLDRAVRSLLDHTLPRRNFATTEPVVLPLRPPSGGAYLQLVHPDGRQEPVMVDALGGDKYALVLRDLPERGVYKVVSREADAAVEGTVTEKTLYELPLAVAGPESESRLAAVERDAALAGVDAAKVRWLGPQEEIGTAGATVRGQYLWKWLMAAVLALLLAELAIIRWMRPSVALRTPAAGARSANLEPVGAGSGAA